MNPDREALTIIEKARAEFVFTNDAVWQFLNHAAKHVERAAVLEEVNTFNAQFREVSA